MWDPELELVDIGVAVKDGVVMLSGFVFNYSDKVQAEADAKRVAGVAGVANDVDRCFLKRSGLILSLPAMQSRRSGLNFHS